MIFFSRSLNNETPTRPRELPDLPRQISGLLKDSAHDTSCQRGAWLGGVKRDQFQNDVAMPAKWRASGGSVGPADTEAYRTGCDKLVAVDYIYIFPTNAPPILEMAAAAAKTSSNYEIIRQIWGSVTGK